MKKLLLIFTLLSATYVHSMKHITKNFKKMSFKKMNSNNAFSKKFLSNKMLKYGVIATTIGGATYLIYQEIEENKKIDFSLTQATYIPTINEVVEAFSRIIAGKEGLYDQEILVACGFNLALFLENNFTRISNAQIYNLLEAIAQNPTYLALFIQGINNYCINQGTDSSEANLFIEKLLSPFPVLHYIAIKEEK